MIMTLWVNTDFLFKDQRNHFPIIPVISLITLEH